MNLVGLIVVGIGLYATGLMLLMKSLLLKLLS